MNKTRKMLHIRLILVLFFATAIAFSSCSKDDNTFDATSIIEENEAGNGNSSESSTSSAIRIMKCTLTPTSNSIAIQLSISHEPSSIKIYYGTGSTFSMSKSISNVSGTKLATTLTALKRDTKYCIKFIVKDKEMNTLESSKYYCTTTK